jgi:hypothetical protein
VYSNEEVETYGDDEEEQMTGALRKRMARQALKTSASVTSSSSLVRVQSPKEGGAAASTSASATASVSAAPAVGDDVKSAAGSIVTGVGVGSEAGGGALSLSVTMTDKKSSMRRSRRSMRKKTSMGRSVKSARSGRSGSPHLPRIGQAGAAAPPAEQLRPSDFTYGPDYLRATATDKGGFYGRMSMAFFQQPAEAAPQPTELHRKYEAAVEYSKTEEYRANSQIMTLPDIAKSDLGAWVDGWINNLIQYLNDD